MKKTFLLILALLTLLFSACDCVAETPYLSSAQRSEIETALYDTLTVETLYNDQTYAMVSYANNTAWDLADMIVVFPDNNRSLALSTLPHGTAARREFYIRDSFTDLKPGTPLNLYVRYTIGDYTYQTPIRSVTVGSLPVPEVLVELENGTVPLSYEEPTTFGSVNRIKGLKPEHIASMSVTVSSLHYGEYHLNFSGVGDRSSSQRSDYLIYKLINQDGVVCETGNVYCSSDNSLSFFGNFTFLPYGQYRLRVFYVG